MKRLLIEASTKVSLIRRLTNGEVRLDACIKAKGKHFENMMYDVLFHNSQIMCYETYIQLFFVSQLLTSHDFKF